MRCLRSCLADARRPVPLLSALLPRATDPKPSVSGAKAADLVRVLGQNYQLARQQKRQSADGASLPTTSAKVVAVI
jgi:hypothetical protein